MCVPIDSMVDHDASRRGLWPETAGAGNMDGDWRLETETGPLVCFSAPERRLDDEIDNRH